MGYLTFWVSVTLLAASAYSAWAQSLEIKTLNIPSPCPSRSKLNDMLQVHYVGKLPDNTIFGESKSPGKTFKFRLGVGRVIKGWDEGLVDMCVGEKRQLVIPPNLAYGAKGIRGVIPPGATLTFDVELIKIN